MEDEYLLLTQAAYLLNQTKQGFENLINTGKISCQVYRGVRLIRVSDLKSYVKKQMQKYQLAKTYLAAENKSSFWMMQHQTFQNRGLCHDESMIEYLTISQVAYLLNMSRQAVHGFVNRGKMKKKYVEIPKRITPLVFIRADEVERYVKKKDEKFNRAIEFFQAEDTCCFWEEHSDDFEQNWIKNNKERNQKYYENKKKKIQERACSAG